MLPNISTATVHRWGTGHKRCPARARRTNVPPKNYFLTLVQLVAVSVGVPIFGVVPIQFLAHDTSKRVQGGSYL